MTTAAETTTTSPKIYITLPADAEPDWLYCHYDGQHEPQPVYLSLDIRDGRATLDYNANIGGGSSMDEHHGLIRGWGVAHPLTPQQALDMLESVRPLLQRVLDTTEEVWDGNNYVGRSTLDPDDHDTECEIMAALDDWDYETRSLNVCAAGDWLEPTTDDEISEALAAAGGDAELLAQSWHDEAWPEYWLDTDDLAREIVSRLED